MSSYCESGYLSRYGAINDSLNNDALTLKEMLLDFFFLSFTYFGPQGLWKERKSRPDVNAYLLLFFCMCCTVFAFIKWWWCINSVDNIMDFFLSLFFLFCHCSLIETSEDLKICAYFFSTIWFHFFPYSKTDSFFLLRISPKVIKLCLICFITFLQWWNFFFIHEGNEDLLCIIYRRQKDLNMKFL